MANKKKIFGKVKERVLELLSQKQTPYSIGKEIGVSKDTVKKFLIDNNLPIYDRNSKKQQVYKDFVKDYRSTLSITESRKKFNISYNKAVNILKQNNITHRDRKQNAVINKTLSLKEAQLRLPDQSDKVIGFENKKYKVIAEDGFIYYKSSSKLYQGDPRGKSGSVIPVEEVASKLEKIGFILNKETYVNIRKPLEAFCTKCKNIRRNRYKLFFDQSCGYCSNNGVSKQEQDISEFIKELGFDHKKFRFKGKTKGKEIDIYIPSLNLGIEYCGLYWHNEDSPEPRTRSYHYEKMKKCNENNIRLITIFEDEWVNRQKQVKNFLKSILSVYDRKLYARKCEVREEFDIDLVRSFLNENHIQGGKSINIDSAVGIYFKGELLGVCVGGFHHRNNLEYVLNRLCFKDGVQIVGGASKMLKLFKKVVKEKNQCSKIVSWSDNRWSEGNVYEKCGFELECELPPDYSYVKGRERIAKQSCKKSNLLKKGGVGNTEKEMAKSLGMSRIWDCGKKRYFVVL